MNSYLIISYLLLSIIVGASADALRKRGLGILSHMGGALEIGLCLVGATLFQMTIISLIPYVLGYIFLRMAVFDLVWALVKGDVPWYYVGSRSFWDQVLRKHPVHGRTFMRIICLAAGVAIILKEIGPL